MSIYNTKTSITIRKKEKKLMKNFIKQNKAITLIALVITIVLNCSSLAMERMYKKEKILKIN